MDVDERVSPLLGPFLLIANNKSEQSLYLFQHIHWDLSWSNMPMQRVALFDYITTTYVLFQYQCCYKAWYYV